MNIQEIKEAIKELEAEELTLSNARNLASLYIIYNNVEKSLTSQNTASNDYHYNNVESELNDIFPAYKHYQQLKRRYQLKEVSDEGLPTAMKFVTKELSEFISALYNNTYLRKERKCIEEMIKELGEKFHS